MSTKMSSATLTAALAGTLLLLSGCGWVDSTGNQGGDVVLVAGSNNQTVQSVQPTSGGGNDLLFDGGTVAINENSTRRFLLADAPRDAGTWTWRLLSDSNALANCSGLNTFDSDVAIEQIQPACADGSDCEVRVQAIRGNGRTEFEVSMPVLTTPVALGVSLESVLASGATHTQVQHLCAIAINEAPDINDDTYRALSTQAREVRANALDAIFNNDSDDEHIRNQPLFVKEVLQAPLQAEEFSINADGSFRYKAIETSALPEGDTRVDRIGILVSDGFHDVESAITVNVVDSNVGPTLQLRVPDFTLTATDQNAAILNQSLALYFNDADGDELQYQLLPNELTEDGLLSVSSSGVLSGAFTMADIGSVPVTVMVSDGLADIAEGFNIIVRDNRIPNRAPTVSDIRNRRVSDLFSYDVSVFFTDADGDELSFTAENLPPGVSLSSEGVMTGVATDENDGQWFIAVTASDGRGGSVDDRFRLIIDN